MSGEEDGAGESVGGGVGGDGGGLDARLGALEAAVRSAGEVLASLEREQVIERALIEARAVAPLTAARALAAAMKDRPGVAVEKLVKELRSTRPELFRAGESGARGGSAGGGAGVMGARSGGPGGGGGAGGGGGEAVIREARGGDRKAVAEYLRRRRGG